MSSYTLTADNKKITWGTSVEIAPLLRAKPSILTVQEDGSVDWRLAEGVYVAKDIVRELDILLEAVLLKLGEAADPRLLLDNLQANLAIEGREADLPLGQLELTGKAGVEVTRQARQIGEKLSLWAREYNVEKSAARQHDPQTLGNVYFRSHCENHLWTHRVADLLMGPAGGPVVMQMFNEYLHQFILLRDALLPFKNWEEVPIEIRQGADSDRGVRFIEQPRAKFLTAIMSKKITHKALVEYAQGWLSPELSAVGYGFQYRLGTILPASLNGHPGTAPGYLLQWYPVWTVSADAAGAAVPVAFRYGEEEYFAAPRSQVLAGEAWNLAQPDPQQLQHVTEARIVPVTVQDRVLLNYDLELDGVTYQVDLGQIFRGHRFMYRPNGQVEPGLPASPAEYVDIAGHRPADILGLPGLVTDKEGIHVISAGGNPLVLWALLGKIYPENVVVLDSLSGQGLRSAQSAGKGFGPKFLLSLGNSGQ